MVFEGCARMVNTNVGYCMQYHFCPFCGQRYPKPEGTQYTCLSCHKTVYLHSKPTVSVLIVDGERVLLGKRGTEPSKGMWDIIGGFLNYGEHPHDGAIREAKEESGLDVEVVEYLGSFMDVYGKDEEATLNMCFTSSVIGGEMQPNDDIVELKWFSSNELPKELAFDNGHQMLNAWKTSLNT